MLCGVLISSSSGIVLFSKEYKPCIPQPRMLAGLISAMMESSAHQIGYKTAFIHFAKRLHTFACCRSNTLVSLAFAQDTKTTLTCIVFYDRTDQPEFGRILSRAILSGFTHEFAQQISRGGPWSESQFEGFHRVLAEVIKGSIQTIIQNLVGERGVDRVAVSVGSSFYSTDEVDQVSFLPNLEALLASSADMMQFYEDFAFVLTMGNAKKRIVIQQIERATVIVICSARMEIERCRELVSETCVMVERVLLVQPEEELVF